MFRFFGFLFFWKTSFLEGKQVANVKALVSI